MFCLIDNLEGLLIFYGLVLGKGLLILFGRGNSKREKVGEKRIWSNFVVAGIVVVEVVQVVQVVEVVQVVKVDK